jgi:hypothetical protein
MDIVPNRSFMYVVRKGRAMILSRPRQDRERVLPPPWGPDHASSVAEGPSACYAYGVDRARRRSRPVPVITLLDTRVAP